MSEQVEASEGQKVPWVMAEPKEVEAGEEQSNPFWLVVLAGLFTMLWFWAGPRYFVVVMGLLVMIFLHELGHFVTARWTGMKPTQFFLFMGPRIWSFQRGERVRPSAAPDRGVRQDRRDEQP